MPPAPKCKLIVHNTHATQSPHRLHLSEIGDDMAPTTSSGIKPPRISTPTTPLLAPSLQYDDTHWLIPTTPQSALFIALLRWKRGGKKTKRIFHKDFFTNRDPLLPPAHFVKCQHFLSTIPKPPQTPRMITSIIVLHTCIPLCRASNND